MVRIFHLLNRFCVIPVGLNASSEKGGAEVVQDLTVFLPVSQVACMELRSLGFSLSICKDIGADVLVSFNSTASPPIIRISMREYFI